VSAAFEAGRVLRFTWQDVTNRREATVVRLAQALVREQ
jgi:hypothetical protein